MGVAVVLRNAAEVIWGRQQLAVPSVFGDNAVRINVGFFQFGILPQEVFILVASMAAMGMVLVFLKRSLFGKAMAAVALNPAAAGLMGINVRGVVILAYILSSVLAGLAGLLVAPGALRLFADGRTAGIEGLLGGNHWWFGKPLRHLDCWPAAWRGRVHGGHLQRGVA